MDAATDVSNITAASASEEISAGLSSSYAAAADADSSANRRMQEIAP